MSSALIGARHSHTNLSNSGRCLTEPNPQVPSPDRRPLAPCSPTQQARIHTEDLPGDIFLARPIELGDLYIGKPSTYCVTLHGGPNDLAWRLLDSFDKQRSADGVNASAVTRSLIDELENRQHPLQAMWVASVRAVYPPSPETEVDLGLARLSAYLESIDWREKFIDRIRAQTPEPGDETRRWFCQHFALMPRSAATAELIRGAGSAGQNNGPRYYATRQN